MKFEVFETLKNLWFSGVFSLNFSLYLRYKNYTFLYIFLLNMEELTIKDITIKNPYKSKIKKDPELEFNKNSNNSQKDWNIKKIKNTYSKPYFSNKVNSWDGDLAYFPIGRRMYSFLFLVNINTRYLHIIDIKDKTAKSLKDAFDRLFKRGILINSLRFDGEKAIESLIKNKYFDKKGINVYNHKSNYTNYCEIVNRTIRTIRDLLSKFTYRTKTQLFNLLAQLAYIYNNSYHSGIGMKPVEMTYEFEYAYIKEKQKELFNVNNKLSKAGFKDYQIGDRVLVYIDDSRTNDKFYKKRGNYVNKSTFLGYTHGNCLVLPDNFDGSIEVPIYCVKPMK